ncbi:ABC-2 type transport system ATP-binding protein [Arthrobacter alpinus]|uniref:ABC-2 type transport system ATP-binding protein n=1 Tax=Arthrobacter alpinus TaxID=656366 RepID=A0A1H5J4X6_9MICC|nr:ABC transporter ATP-binding protein [Arthrobacter alpinus]SEE47593.1 ABC-2 type transport system ATP-binding protein [Arthrobacter alpinus]
MTNTFSPALEISGLIKDVGPVPGLDGRMKRVVSNISLTAHFGAVTALLGANGAGKTTTIECAQGLQVRTGGEISLLGQDPQNADAGLRARVGVMLQDGGLPPSARPVALLRHVATLYENPLSVDALVERLGIAEFADTNIRRLSGGQKQRVSLAASLIGNPEVLFLDEPSAGLDPQSRLMVFELIRELRDSGKAIVLTTHLLDDAQRLADYVYIVDKGASVAQGTVQELLEQSTAALSKRVMTFEATPHLNVDALLRPGISCTETRPGSYSIAGDLEPSDLGRFGTWCTQNAIMPTSVHLASQSLEDVFLSISGAGNNHETMGIS